MGRKGKGWVRGGVGLDKGGEGGGEGVGGG